MTVRMWIAVIAWVSLTCGLIKRRDRGAHVLCMLTGVILDVGLVLYLQVTRDAVQTALGFSLSILEQIHIACSTVALLLYFPVLYLGLSLLRGGDPAKRKWHIRLALAAYTSRTLGLLFMFSMIK